MIHFLQTMLLLLARSASVSAWMRSPPVYRCPRRFSSCSIPVHLSKHPNSPQKNVLHQVQESVNNVLNQYPDHDTADKNFIHSLDPEAREAYGVAQILQKRIHSFYRPGVNCPTCWFQEAHCVCSRCPPINLEKLPINRVFVVMNHKEICLAVDTAKLILSSFPTQSRLVVAGIGAECQASMREMLEAIEQEGKETDCLILFPTDDAKTFAKINTQEVAPVQENHNCPKKYELIVIDGTWSQARKIHARLFGGCSTTRVQLSEESLASLSAAQSTGSSSDINGHSQLRRHPIDWRTISTMEATRLLLKDIAMETSCSENSHGNAPFWEDLLRYQQLVNQAALKQLGPPRAKKSWSDRQSSLFKYELNDLSG